MNQIAKENFTITHESNFQAKSIGSITGVRDLSQLVSKKTSKENVIPSNDIINATNNNDVNITVRKDVHNNQDTDSNNTTKKMTSTIATTVKTSRMNINQKSLQ